MNALVLNNGNRIRVSIVNGRINHETTSYENGVSSWEGSGVAEHLTIGRNAEETKLAHAHPRSNETVTFIFVAPTAQLGITYYEYLNELNVQTRVNGEFASITSYAGAVRIVVLD